MSSSFGTLFRITTWGESHGGAVGVVVDGCPPRIPISLEEIQFELDRRRPGQSKIVTQRKESDTVEILSGLQDGLTLGTPILMMVRNEDARSRDYDELKEKYRPSHADFAYDEKYGIRAWSGGGRASARETIGRVAAGALAKKVLASYGVEVLAWVEKVHHILATVDPKSVTLNDVEANIVRCPDPAVAEQMIAHIEEIRKDGNSVGGVVGCVARGVPSGWGEPVFDKLEADLAKAVMSLPACKGFEVGSGFAGTELTGREHNDPYRSSGTSTPHPPSSSGAQDIAARGGGQNAGVITTSNFSGGIQGGISNGMPITMRAAFKPTATIMSEQDTVDVQHQNTTISGRGRHDPCVLPRAVPMVEAMVALVLVDHALRQKAIS
jgi:chorismate synthase